ncbi:MAG TPA: YdeI/OmpD-associated family protein [bacterium]|jgi:hypothetical protein
MPKSDQQEFKAPLIFGDGGGAWVEVPAKIMDIYATKGRVPVNALIDGVPYRGSLANMGGGCHQLGVLKAIREKIGKGEGDVVHVILERDTAERSVEAPEDFQKALNKNKAAKAVFEKFAYSHKKEYVRWIEEAKKAETRAARIEKAVGMIAEGQKRS